MNARPTLPNAPTEEEPRVLNLRAGAKYLGIRRPEAPSKTTPVKTFDG
jgi:hypothetical protein